MRNMSDMKGSRMNFSRNAFLKNHVNPVKNLPFINLMFLMSKLPIFK
jgi:hypothetical protein